MSYEEEDTCMSYEEEDTCMSYEEEDTCMLYEEEDTCMSYDTLHLPASKRPNISLARITCHVGACMSYEEEDTCTSHEEGDTYQPCSYILSQILETQRPTTIPIPQESGTQLSSNINDSSWMRVGSRLYICLTFQNGVACAQNDLRRAVLNCLNLLCKGLRL